MMVEDGVPAPTQRPKWHSIDIHGQRPQMQMHPTPTHLQRQSAALSHMSWPHEHTLARSLQRHHVHCSWHTLMLPPLSLSTDQVPMNAAGYSIIHTVCPVVQGVKWAASTMSTPTQWPVSQQTLACSLGGCQAGPLPPLLAHAPRRAAHWRAIQTRPAAWPGTGVPYLGAHSPSTAPPPLSSSKWPPTIGSSNVAASPRHAHWETVKQILSATSPIYLTCVSHMWRSAAHRRAIQMRQQHCCGPACHIGVCIPYHQE